MPDPRLLRVCGIVALVAAALPVPCDIVSWFLAENYSPVRNSISALAVGPSSWLIDLGLWCFVLASLAVAVGLWAWRIRARFWTPAIVSLALAGVCVGIIARANEYAGTSNPGANLHMWAVAGLGLFFALAALLAVPGLRLIADGLGRFSLWIGMIWVVLCPVYWFGVPNDWSGAVERLLALVMLTWLIAMARRLRRSGERAAVRPR